MDGEEDTTPPLHPERLFALYVYFPGSACMLDRGPFQGRSVAEDRLFKSPIIMLGLEP